jgi:hypothetical protein
VGSGLACREGLVGLLGRATQINEGSLRDSGELYRTFNNLGAKAGSGFSRNGLQRRPE